jgi:RNA polymerase sigma factor (sigma-70 family)
MVLGVCRRILHHGHDAEDAFQTTFLVLVRKARSILPREMLGNWLHGVAYRTAVKVRAATAKRRAKERQVLMRGPVSSEELWHALLSLLDQELERLPDKYRLPIVLCDLEGKTRKHAARQLGWPEGTIATRLTRGRALLAKRLRGHGLALSGGALAAVLMENGAAACVSGALTAATVKTATVTGAMSVRVARLTEGVLKAMLLSKLRIVTAVVVSIGVVSTGMGFLVAPRVINQAAARAQGPGAQSAEPQITAQRSASTREARPAPVQISVTSPEGMTTIVQTKNGAPSERVSVRAPGRLNLEQGQIYRLKLTDIPNRPGVELYPTLEIPMANDTTVELITNSAIPVRFTDADFEHVAAGALISKVIYLPRARDGESPPPSGNVRTLASYETPEQDVIAAARRRGTPLVIIRLGNIDRGDDTSSRVLGKVIRVGDDGKSMGILAPRVPPVPGAVRLKFDEKIDIRVSSKAIKAGGDELKIISIGTGTFHLAKDTRLTATLNAGVLQHTKVDYWIYAAVFDVEGRMLGTASHKEIVEYIRLSATPLMLRKIELDFGISQAFRNAAFVAVTISDPEIAKP